ncbi:transposase [Faecalibacterium prausnitzii]|uniref:Transposase n=1 Tax=Faecalibacterium prausnitzii TaxID=853 RepID=A0A2A6ZZ49_9FIRM|nr:transposase [Faecalibacterium prausnitzii]
MIGGKRLLENTNTSYELRLGKTTFIVCVKQAETAKKPLEKAIFDICKQEILGGTSTAQKFNLENLAKTS